MAKSLVAGRRVDDRSGRLARRLVDRGMATAAPPPSAPAAPVTVVIPVFDDADGLAVTLVALGAGEPGSSPVVVVDDGSEPPVRLPDGPARAVRLESNRGPAAARNAGARSSETELICFVDAGVILEPSVIESLARHLIDPTVVAVAPRVVSSDGASRRISDYERSHSPLDLGPTGGNVAPGTLISYVPSTCLMVRRSAFDAAGGFDEALRFGEDVDLVWRLGEQGTVVYRANLVVTHPPRPSVARMARQRFDYGRSAGRLAERHPGRLAPIRLDGRQVLTIGALLGGHPAVAVAQTGYQSSRLARRLRGRVHQPILAASRMVAGGQIAAVRGALGSTVRPYWPITALAALACPAPVGRVLVAAVAARLPARPASLGLSLVDDLAYGAGVWAGAIERRSARCLRPAWGSVAASVPLPANGSG